MKETNSRVMPSEEEISEPPGDLITQNGNYITTGNIHERKTEEQSVKIGKRSATLYLSSHSIKVQDDLRKLTSREDTRTSVKSRTKAPSINGTSSSRQGSIVKEKSLPPDELLQLRPKREFTFTGYDIMADGELSVFVKDIVFNFTQEHLKFK